MFQHHESSVDAPVDASAGNRKEALNLGGVRPRSRAPLRWRRPSGCRFLARGRCERARRLRPAVEALNRRQARLRQACRSCRSTSVSTVSSRSRASAFFHQHAAVGTASGADHDRHRRASPSAHGHAIMSTATAFTRPSANRGSGPNRLHAANARTAVRTTAGTKYGNAVRQAWIGARLRCASPTMRTI